MVSRDDVLCVGSAVVDRFLQIDQPFSSIAAGDKVLVKSTELHTGGGATNSAAALSLLGLKVKMLTKLGRDHDAEFIVKEMKRYRAPNICRTRSTKKTDSSTIIFSEEEQDRIIFVQKGASQDLMSQDFHLSALNTRWIYLATLMGNSFQTAEILAKYAQKKKINLLFNPSFYLAKKGVRKLQKILRATTILVLNKEEAQALLGKTIPSLPTLLQKLHALGPKTVVITDGAKRMYALHQGKIYSLLPPRVKIVHTAGAGDAFTSGLLAGMIKSWPFADSLQLGQVNASSVIQQSGTKNKLLTEKEARLLMKKYKMIVRTEEGK